MTPTDPYGLRDRVAVVTGGSRGIGAAIARRMSENGARVAVLDLDAPAAGSDAVDVDADTQPVYVRCDVSDEGSVVAAFADVVARLGTVDVLVNNAGINAYYDAATMELADWEHVFAVDLRGVWLCCKQVLPGMAAAGRGAIVNISSIHARMTHPGYFPYAAAKSGVEGLTRSLALDYGPRGIRVNAVAPGYTRTRLVEEWLARQRDPENTERQIGENHALRRMVEPSEVAAAVCFLAGDGATAITGTSLTVDCGLTARFAS